MYAEDSFFNLSLAGRAGLLLLSMLLAGGMIWAASKLYACITIDNRALRLAAKLALALLLFWLFEWLSPQIYYLYYIAIFDGLPWQVVVRAPPGPSDLLELLNFTAKPALSQHARGILGWVLIALAMMPRSKPGGARNSRTN